MSRGNVEAVRRWLELGATSPRQVQENVAGFFDPDADYYPVPKFPDARPCHGHGEITKFFTGFMAAWSTYEMAISRLIAVGDDRVLSCGSLRAEGRETGMTIESDIYHCAWLSNGRCLRMEDHSTLREALRAIGLHGDTLEAAGLE
jgi:SnoaL-like domain